VPVPSIIWTLRFTLNIQRHPPGGGIVYGNCDGCSLVRLLLLLSSGAIAAAADDVKPFRRRERKDLLTLFNQTLIETFNQYLDVCSK